MSSNTVSVSAEPWARRIFSNGWQEVERELTVVEPATGDVLTSTGAATAEDVLTAANSARETADDVGSNAASREGRDLAESRRDLRTRWPENGAVHRARDRGHLSEGSTRSARGRCDSPRCGQSSASGSRSGPAKRSEQDQSGASCAARRCRRYFAIQLSANSLHPSSCSGAGAGQCGRPEAGPTNACNRGTVHCPGV